MQKQREVQRAHSNQQSAQKNKKGNTTTKTQGRRSEGGREKDADSRSSTPVADKNMSRFSKSTSSTVTSSSSHESVSEPPRKKRRLVIITYRFQCINVIIYYSSL